MFRVIPNHGGTVVPPYNIPVGRHYHAADSSSQNVGKGLPTYLNLDVGRHYRAAVFYPWVIPETGIPIMRSNTPATPLHGSAPGRVFYCPRK